MLMLLSEAEGNAEHGVIRQSHSDPARPEPLYPEVLLCRVWEILKVPDEYRAKQERPKAVTLVPKVLGSRIRP
ncbi:hypothetical protein CYL20_04365 [Pseudomonas palleroniana]|uniref:Uncharacterized protein n=1 Tax=Pseudomonas palleroniana TaxID=191390 RepID=A0A2L1J5R3_9PSED|nr:hypothetical protein CYL20_04365 [Pseudomonas palleroniana]